jgi:1-phosphofructokinase
MNGTGVHDDGRDVPGLTVFCPGPALTVTIERFEDGDEIHLHAGGQGVWVARMARALGAAPVVCAPLGGESGTVIEHLLRDEDISLHRVDTASRTAAYVHDRRGADRLPLSEQRTTPLGRHELDDLLDVTLASGIECGTAVLSGTADRRILPAGAFERLAADLGAIGVQTVVDLSGEQLDAAVAGGADVVKVSDEELLREGHVSGRSAEELIACARRILTAGARNVVVSREERPVIAVNAEAIWEATPMPLTIVDHRGAGDSLTAALAVATARGDDLESALRLGVAAGSLNITRHGLATGPRDAIEALSRHVEVRRIG